ncbi:MAG: hypothetical protein N2444_10240, partial [Methylocystis sp.]|nr:hypothetical protein [Methylocystis sp.]
MTRTLLSSTLAYLPVQLASPFVQFLVIVMWTHLLKPDAFGVVTFVIAAQELTGFIGLVWWSLFILRFQKRYVGDDAARLRDMDLRMAAYGSFIQALFAPFCLLALGVELDIATIGASAAYLAARTLLNHYSEWARSRHRVLAYSLAQICGPILGSGLSLITILAFGPSPAIALATMAVGQLIAVFGLMLALGIPPHLGACLLYT